MTYVFHSMRGGRYDLCVSWHEGGDVMTYVFHSMGGVWPGDTRAYYTGVLGAVFHL